MPRIVPSGITAIPVTKPLLGTWTHWLFSVARVHKYVSRPMPRIVPSGITAIPVTKPLLGTWTHWLFSVARVHKYLSRPMPRIVPSGITAIPVTKPLLGTWTHWLFSVARVHKYLSRPMPRIVPGCDAGMGVAVVTTSGVTRSACVKALRGKSTPTEARKNSPGLIGLSKPWGNCTSSRRTDCALIRGPDVLKSHILATLVGAAVSL